MTKAIFALALAAFATGAQAKTFKCEGLYDNKGAELTLKLNLTSLDYTLSGTIVNDPEDSEGFDNTVTCSGTDAGTKRTGYEYFTAEKSADCSADYVRISQDLIAKGSGPLVLSRTSGGDTHDSSGYVYRYYSCK